MFQKHLRNSTEKVIHALNIGTMELANLRQNSFTPEFILLGILEQDDSIVHKILVEMNKEPYKLVERIIERIYAVQPKSEESTPDEVNITLSEDVERLFNFALDESKLLNDKFISTGALFLAFFNPTILPSSQILNDLGLTYDECFKALQNVRNGTHMDSRDAETRENFLQVYGTDLTELAQQGRLDPVIGRDLEVARVIEILARRTKNNPAIIGLAGVGKTVLIEGLAQRIANGRVPETLLNKKIIQIDMTQITAGAKFKGEFEERMKSVVDALVNSNGRIIAFVDDMQSLVESSGGGIKAGDILKPALARGQIQLIGTATNDSFKKYIEKDKALARRFQTIALDPPSVEETIKIVEGIKIKYEQHHKVTYDQVALEAAVRLSDRYISERQLPDKAIDLIDEAGARKHISLISTPPEMLDLENQKTTLKREQSDAFATSDLDNVVEIQNKINSIDEALKLFKKSISNLKSENARTVTQDDISEVISRNTGIPLSRIVETESQKLKTMEEKLHNRIIGQDEAVVTVANAIRRNRAGFKDSSRPIGAFLFLGPTGVGKTELAKALAEFLFDNETHIIRLDMSEYMEKHSVSKMIGSPPGYVGYEEGGQLTEQIRRNPFSIVLLDEMEKANEDVFNLLLQIFDEGRLTDSQGVEASFKNAIIIGTSNLGSSHIFDLEKKIGFAGANQKADNYGVIKEKILEETKKFFKPEFLNRIDDIIVFHPLEQEHINEITKLLLENLTKRVSANGFSISFEDEIYEKIAKLGYTPEFGARPLKRVIESLIENEISSKVISGDFQEGDHILISLENEEIVINKKI